MVGAGLLYSSDLPITTALTAYALSSVDGLGDASELSIEFSFAYGSGGATLQAWLQSTVSQGTRWNDLVSFAATTASKTRMLSLKRTADTGLWTPTNGTLAGDTVASSIVLGDTIRMLVTTTGVYAGATVFSTRINVR